jgi:hypothetical protein
MRGAYKKRPLGDRFREKVGRPDANGCRRWLAAVTAKGYGKFGVGSKIVEAHRVAWELVNGPIAPGLCVLHSCDNPSCVSVGHLRLGTHRENMIEMASKGRSKRGVDHHMTKISESAVRAIRDSHESGISQEAIGQAHGLSQTTIGRIVRRESWRHAP